MLGMMPLPYKLLAGLLALLAVFLAGYASNDGAARVQAAWDNEHLVVVQARAKRLEVVRSVEAALQAAANEDRRRTNAERDRLLARADALARELRNRPERPTGQPALPAGAAGPGAAGACTGAGLYRDDGVFLIGQARMCEDIRNQRDEYLRQYQRAQQRLRALGQQP